MSFAYQLDGVWTEIFGAFANEYFSFPPGWADAVTEEERLAVGIHAILEEVQPPLGHQRLIGTEIIDVGGEPTRRGIYEEITVAERQENMVSTIRSLRWEREQGGFMGPGGFVRTDEAARNTALHVVVYMDKAGAASVDWELAPSTYVTASAQDVTDMLIAVGAHIQACATQARGLTEAVQAATTHAELSAIDVNAGWPM